MNIQDLMVWACFVYKSKLLKKTCVISYPIHSSITFCLNKYTCSTNWFKHPDVGFCVNTASFP